MNLPITSCYSSHPVQRGCIVGRISGVSYGARGLSPKYYNIEPDLTAKLNPEDIAEAYASDKQHRSLQF